MKTSKLKFSFYLLVVIALTFGVSVSLQSLLAAVWNAPTALPPGNNVSVPIYSISSVDQLITGGGGLGMAGPLSSVGLAVNGGWISNDGDNEGIRIDNIGRVGIGVNPPTVALDVSGEIKATGDICGNGICLSAVGGSGGVNAGTQGQAAYYQSDGSIVSGSSNLFISASGNVGIGTTNPGTNKLEVVNGPIKATGGLIIETRASDPASPVDGQIWLRTDL